MSKEFHQDAWLHADERGVGYRSYWQMKPLLAMEYPGCVFYGVWGSDSTGTSFPSGPSVCVVRRGYEGPLQSVQDQHYVVHEQHTHQFSSTRVRKAIASGDVSLVNSMVCPALSWIVIGLFSPDPVERNTAYQALRLLDQTSSEDEDEDKDVAPTTSASRSSSDTAPLPSVDSRAPLERRRKAARTLETEELIVPVVQREVLSAKATVPGTTLVADEMRAGPANADLIQDAPPAGENVEQDIGQSVDVHTLKKPTLPVNMRVVQANAVPAK
eukprot:212355-Amphidinium_carterae.1